MEEYIQITVRFHKNRDIDIRVHAKQKWEYITNILCENGIIPGTSKSFSYKSLRQGKEFEGKFSSKEVGIYTGDIIELGERHG